MSHLQNLNKEQLEAVTHTEGPLLIVAGAGAGKTRAITHRIVHLIKKGVAPESILAVTFTNKAAKEMRVRVRALIEKDKEINRPVSALSSGMSLPFVSTFHSLCVNLLREHHRELGLPKSFTILDRADSVRAIKRAMKLAGVDTKTYEPGSILNTISKQKGDAVTRSEFAAEPSSNPYHSVVADVWRKYDAILEKENALDFDDLLLRAYLFLKDSANARQKLQNRWRYIHIDEYQDTNTVQYEIVRLLVGKEKNICVVADQDQCLVAGTKITMANGKTKGIERIKKGDSVLSNYGGGKTLPAQVTKVRKHIATNGTIKITMQSGNVLESTPEHIHFAGYKLGVSPQVYITYLMYKKTVGWRIGVSQTYTNGQIKPMLGYMQRRNQEHADAVWVIATHKNINKAREFEYITSLKYQIPTIPFVARKTNARIQNGYVHDQKVLDDIFAKFDTDKSATRLLKDYGLYKEYPHHRPQASRSDRRNIIATICSDPRGNSVLHSISVYGNDATGKKALASAGLKTRWGGHNPNNWRFEAKRVSMGEWQNIIKKIQQALPETNVIYQARIGKTAEIKGEKNSLPFLPASSVRQGMLMCDDKGEWDIVRKVEVIDRKDKTVYDLDVQHTHNFIANNIVTHNCIYGWRGAKPSNVFEFEKEFGSETILLERNYRSTQTILAAANGIITKNANRYDKKLFTENENGELIGVYGAMDAGDEARFIVAQAQKLLESGISPREIAVLYRANFQSRAIEEAFLYVGVPYQVLGTRFFDRKEIKDLLSYVRAALNPDSVGDISRIVAVPPRGIGKQTLARMLEGTENALTPAALKKVTEFKKLLADIAEAVKTRKPSEVLRFIIKESGLEQKLKNGTEDEKERYENMQELVTLATKYDSLTGGEGMEKLLEDAALATDQDELEEQSNSVKLMTVHASKGLEFDYVFIAGLEEGLFPHERIGDGEADEEEERRLFYVALTRARKKVYLSHTFIRTIYGKQQINTPSQFITDIDDDCIEALENSAPNELPHNRHVGLMDDIDF